MRTFHHARGRHLDLAQRILLCVYGAEGHVVRLEDDVLGVERKALLPGPGHVVQLARGVLEADVAGRLDRGSRVVLCVQDNLAGTADVALHFGVEAACGEGVDSKAHRVHKFNAFRASRGRRTVLKHGDLVARTLERDVGGGIVCDELLCGNERRRGTARSMKLLLRATLEREVVGVYHARVNLLRQLAVEHNVVLCGAGPAYAAQVASLLGGRAIGSSTDGKRTVAGKLAAFQGLNRTLVAIPLFHVAGDFLHRKDSRLLGTAILNDIAGNLVEPCISVIKFVLAFNLVRTDRSAVLRKCLRGGGRRNRNLVVHFDDPSDGRILVHIHIRRVDCTLGLGECVAKCDVAAFRRDGVSDNRRRIIGAVLLNRRLEKDVLAVIGDNRTAGPGLHNRAADDQVRARTRFGGERAAVLLSKRAGQVGGGSGAVRPEGDRAAVLRQGRSIDDLAHRHIPGDGRGRAVEG